MQTRDTSQNDGFYAPLWPADGQARGLWVAPAGHPPPAGGGLTPAQWDFAAVRSGVATVTAAVAEAFVPQMLNYESVDGVSFSKGCYPGQEVVARSQFRGAIKRRAYVGWVDGAAQAGQDVFAPGADGQPVGIVAQAAAAPQGGTAVIAVLRSEDVAACPAFHVGSPSGPALTQLVVPYPLRDDL